MKYVPEIVEAPIVSGVVDAKDVIELRDLCAQAQIPYRFFGGNPPAIGFHKDRNVKARLPNGRRLLLVDSRSLPSTNPERAIRALEILAHGFHDLAARESVRGLFGVD
jgi:hypothetical protein